MSFPLSGAASRRLLFGSSFAFGLFLLTTGCGPDYKARGIVKGRVTSKGKPLTTGTVMFYNKNGITAQAHINTDGTYEMKDAPIGECQVTVTVPKLPMDPGTKARLKGTGGGPKMPEMKAPEGYTGEMPSAPTIPKEIVPADAKYEKTETSGLKFTVEKGEQTYNIDL